MVDAGCFVGFDAMNDDNARRGTIMVYGQKPWSNLNLRAGTANRPERLKTDELRPSTYDLFNPPRFPFLNEGGHPLFAII